MGTRLNSTGRAHAEALIGAGKVNKDAAWSFTAEDGDKLLGSSGDNWAAYGAAHLAVDPDETNNTKGHWKYPFEKGGELYRSALTAIRQRAGQQHDTSIFDAAGALLERIDGKTAANAAPASLIERRSFAIDALRIERRDDGCAMIRGHAAVFNALSEDLGGFREKIAPGAFSRAIGEDDVRALINHDPNLVLGRNRAGTLTLAEDARGLAISLAPPDTQYARDLMTCMERGDINQMSFGFEVHDGGQDWEQKSDGPIVRTLTSVRLYDVSAVTFPAYPQTDVGLRSLRAWQAERQPARQPTNLLRALALNAGL